ncbi:glycosyltransferase involved in cell wall biosynthesis [Paenibacillus sp. V4I3]|uniref:glycosyltransferase family 4 protein n=1 Tax=unclassified Paenibacillus TaxID=185978 RepID=UPI002782BDC8|nr:MULTISPECIES: glycosyltransferase family 4 protein [unclassified Paenibacillus]MDQ0878118.1 glycosyltransferase involved in cell wall biosynthesis [Paenibacillus sp. V4I3]MDQ0886060.1 glycosyltransferase involved in cell wall biosynthesis [Paenibacillus sp. V4I9]
MKILVTYYIASGGVETLNRMKYKALQKYGIDCHFLYQWTGGGISNAYDIPVHVSEDYEYIQNLLRRENFDLVIVCSNFYMLRLIREFGFAGPVVYEVQGLGTWDEAREILHQAIPFIHAHCNAALYPVTSHLVALFNSIFPGLKRYCFHNGLDTEQFKYRTLPRKMNPLIGWVGRIEPNKNWQYFLQIARHLLEENPLINIWMIGEQNLGSEKDRQVFNQLMVNSPFQSRVTWHANVPYHEMDHYYSMIGDSGGFLCSTSICEGFGYAVAEAMCCRCPVVVTDSDGIRSMVIHNVTGKLIDQYELNQAVSEAKEVLYNNALRADLILQAEQHVKSIFTLDAYGWNLNKMIRELVGN